jgi:hypothetical protein
MFDYYECAMREHESVFLFRTRAVTRCKQILPAQCACPRFYVSMPGQPLPSLINRLAFLSFITSSFYLSTRDSKDPYNIMSLSITKDTQLCFMQISLQCLGFEALQILQILNNTQLLFVIEKDFIT